MITVGVFSDKGGVGKSTLITNATYLLNAKAKTVVLDLGLNDKTATRILAPHCVTKSPGVAEYLYGFSDDVYICDESDGALVDVVPPGSIRPIRSSSYYELVRRMSRLTFSLLRYYQLVVIDLPGRSFEDTPIVQAIVAVTDLALLVAEPTAYSITAVQALWNKLVERVEPQPLIAVVVNKVVKSMKREMSSLVRGAFYVEVPLSADVMALSSANGALHIQHVKDKEWIKSVETVAKEIMKTMLRYRHVERRVF